MSNIKKYNVLFIFLFLSFLGNQLVAQSFWFGPKGGMGLGIQKRNSSEGQALFAGHAAFFIETYSEEELEGSLYASLGLHQRGSSNRSFYNILQNFNVPSTRFVYNNVSLQVGVKKMRTKHFFYLVGVRGEYTVFTNLDKLNNGIVSYYYPQNEFVKPLVAGITGGGGLQYDLSELYGVSIELTVNQDLIRQYYSPAIPGIISPVSGREVVLRETQFKNTTLELSFSFRFLRKVIYY